MTILGRRILLATTNPAKLERLAWLLKGLGMELLRPADLKLEPSVAEEGPSHRAIAELKAGAWSQAAGILAIASDGGVSIPALGDAWDSRLTHRFTSPGLNDIQRAQRLLELMRPYRGSARRIFWTEAVAIADQGRLLWSWETAGAEGVLAEDLSQNPGIPGFWVAGLWHFPALGKLYTELTQTELDTLGDHWSRLRSQVRAFLSGATGEQPQSG